MTQRITLHTKKRVAKGLLAFTLLWQVHSHAIAPSMLPVQGDKLALVIGNSSYQQNPLVNPVNDARVMADLLRQSGFAVDLILDAPSIKMREAVARMRQKSTDPAVDTTLFYYAGHGMQLQWRNFLIGVDARIANAQDVPANSLDLAEVLVTNTVGKPGGKSRKMVVILDACRDNPFRSLLNLTQKGLSQFDAPPNTLVAFSTAPGQLALDGEGSNSIYTSLLVKELNVPGIPIEDALKRVRMGVRVASLGRQIPWESTSLEENLYLRRNEVKNRNLAIEELEEVIKREVAAWDQIKKSGDIASLVAFLQDFPNGNLNQLAQHKLEGLLARRASQEAEQMAQQQRNANQRADEAARLKAQQQAILLAQEKEAALKREAEAEAQQLAAQTLQHQKDQTAQTTPTASPKPTPTVDNALATVSPLIHSMLDAANKTHTTPIAVSAALLAAPIPTVLRVSATPNFQGAEPLNRRFGVGDQYVYSVLNQMNGVQRQQTNTVTRVDEAADQVEYNQGEFTSDLMGNATNTDMGKLGSPRQFYPATLQIGQRWITAFYQPRASGNTQYFQYNVRVVALETVTVPAGTFQAFRIEAIGYNLRQGHRIERTLWVAPGVNANIASVVKTQNPRGMLEQNERRELIQYRSNHSPTLINQAAL